MFQHFLKGGLDLFQRSVNGSFQGAKRGVKEEGTNFTRFWKLVSRRE